MAGVSLKSLLAPAQEMTLSFSVADQSDAPALALLHISVAYDLTHRFGKGVWSARTTERGVLAGMRHSRVLIARRGTEIVGTLRLQTKKPWAIDISYFTPVKKALYLTSMAVTPGSQHQGVGGLLLKQAVKEARAWPVESIRLDAFDRDAGAGVFYAKCGLQECGRTTYRNTPLIYFELVL
jgi:GNAT superfamily N-acetyltransferase